MAYNLVIIAYITISLSAIYSKLLSTYPTHITPLQFLYPLPSQLIWQHKIYQKICSHFSDFTEGFSLESRDDIQKGHHTSIVWTISIHIIYISLIHSKHCTIHLWWRIKCFRSDSKLIVYIIHIVYYPSEERLLLGITCDLLGYFFLDEEDSAWV